MSLCIYVLEFIQVLTFVPGAEPKVRTRVNFDLSNDNKHSSSRPSTKAAMSPSLARKKMTEQKQPRVQAESEKK